MVQTAPGTKAQMGVEALLPPDSANALPVVIPQTRTSWKGRQMCPFVRAYPPGLSAQGIDQNEFLEFLDGFNEAFVASPVFQAANTTGVVMSQFHGLEPVQLTGVGLQVAAGVGSAAVSLMRTRAYMKAANADFFHPRGLTAAVLTSKELTARIGYPQEKIQLLPQDISSDDSSSENSQQAPATFGNEAIARRIDALEGYVQPLDFDVPPSARSENFMKRMGEWQAQRLAKKHQKRLTKRHHKHERKHEKRSLKVDEAQVKMEGKLAELELKLQQNEISRDRKLASPEVQSNPKLLKRVEAEFVEDTSKIQEKIEKTRTKGERKIEKRQDKVEHGREKMDRKENKTVNKVRWIVITKWDHGQTDAGIDDEEIELAKKESEYSSGSESSQE